MSSVKKSDVWLCDNCFSLSSHFQTFGLILQFSQFFQEIRFISFLIMKIYLLYYLIEILKAEVCLKNIRTIYKTTFPGSFRGIRTITTPFRWLKWVSLTGISNDGIKNVVFLKLFLDKCYEKLSDVNYPPDTISEGLTSFLFFVLV